MGKNFHAYREKKSKPSTKRFLLYVGVLVVLGGSAAFGVFFAANASSAAAAAANALPGLTPGGEAAVQTHPGLLSNATIPLWTTFDNGTEAYGTPGKIQLFSYIHENPIHSTNDLFPPSTVQSLGYGIIFLELDNGTGLFVGCHNYSEPNESCYAAVLGPVTLADNQIEQLLSE